MGSVKEILARRLSSEGFDRRLGQYFCFAGAPVILVLAIWKLGSLRLDEFQLLVGVVSVITSAMVMVILGFLIAPYNHKDPVTVKPDPRP